MAKRKAKTRSKKKSTPTTATTEVQPGRVIPCATIGGSSNTDVDSLAPRWKAEPYVELWDQFDRAKSWLKANGRKVEFAALNPMGYPRVETMPLDAPMRMKARNETYYHQMLHGLESVAIASDLPLLIYTGCMHEYEWKDAEDLRPCFAPYAFGGRTSIAIDQSADLARTPKNRKALFALRCMFADVLIEGCWRASNMWMSAPHPNAVQDSAWIDIYSKNARFATPIVGDYVLLTTVPKALEGASDDEKHAHRIERLKFWIPKGVHCIVGSSTLERVTWDAIVGGKQAA